MLKQNKTKYFIIFYYFFKHLVLCRPLYRCFILFIPHFYLFIYYYFLTQVTTCDGHTELAKLTIYIELQISKISF